MHATNQAIEGLGSEVNNLKQDNTVIHQKIDNIDARVTNYYNEYKTDIQNLQGDVTVLAGGVSALAEGEDGFFQVSQERRDPKPSPLGLNSAAGGVNAVASGNDSLAVGNDAQAKGDKSVAMGNAAVASGEQAVSLGYTATASGTGSMALGGSSMAMAEKSVALGTAASATAANSVALGADSQATRGASKDYSAIGVGAGQNSAGEVSVGAQGAERQITNVAPGMNGTDAVNVNQLAGAINGVSKRIEEEGKDARAGTAAAMAMANMPQAFIPGKSMMAAGVGTYRGQAAAAVGLSRLSDSGRSVIKLSGSVDSRGHVGVAAGFGVHW